MAPTADQVTAALGGVIDPEIKKPITELGMVESVVVKTDGVVAVKILLTVAGCPMKDTLRRDTTAAVSALDGVTGRYFANSREARPSRAAQDMAAAERLWEISATMTAA